MYYVDLNEMTIRPIFVQKEEENQVFFTWPTSLHPNGKTIAVANKENVFRKIEDCIEKLWNKQK